MPHSVLAIANEFIDLASSDNRRITPMHLQKYSYLSHGFSLALFDEPLTSDRLEAWDYGPVFPELYDALKKYGSGDVADLIHANNWAILDHIRGNIVRSNFDDRQNRLISTVWKDYGEFDAFQLSALTHTADTPWVKSYVPGKKNIQIRNRLIKDYFVELTRQAGSV